MLSNHGSYNDEIEPYLIYVLLKLYDTLFFYTKVNTLI